MERETDQRISDNMATLLIRECLHPQVALNWIRNPCGARSDFLPATLQAIGERLPGSRR